MSWTITETATGRKETLYSDSEFKLRQAYYTGLNINYSVLHNGIVKEVKFIKHDPTL